MMKKVMMKKWLFLILFPLCISFFSCEKEKDGTSYTDLIKQEKAILEQFVKEKGFKVLNEFPGDSIFAEDEFFLLDNGVYLRIIDNGDGISPTKGAKIETVAKGVFLAKGEMTKFFDGFDSSAGEVNWPLEFNYGDEVFADDIYLSTGYADVLKYVGNNSTVSMIVPFAVGSYRQNV